MKKHPKTTLGALYIITMLVLIAISLQSCRTCKAHSGKWDTVRRRQTMKRVVIFHFSYKGNANGGNRTTRMSYSIFKSKSAIIDEFFDWVKLKNLEIAESYGEECAITNIQIIGL